MLRKIWILITIWACQGPIDPKLGVWEAKEQCFFKDNWECADLQKEETRSFWRFRNNTELFVNDLPCQYKVLGENLVVICHALGKQVYEIVKWDEAELELVDQEKKEKFRWKR